MDSLLMLTSTIRVYMGASASSDLDILTIWDSLKAILVKVYEIQVVFTIDLDILMEVRM